MFSRLGKRTTYQYLCFNSKLPDESATPDKKPVDGVRKSRKMGEVTEDTYVIEEDDLQNMKNMLMGSPNNNDALKDENDSPEITGDKTDKRKKSLLGKSIGGAQSAFLGVSREKAANSIVKLIYILIGRM